MTNKTTEIIKSRRSIRRYIEKEIPEEILRDIMDCARLAPTGNNKQPWTFVVVTDKELRDKISYFARYGKFIKEAGACIAVFCDEENSTTPLQDACAATENIIISAQSYGLGTCWVNSYKKEHSGKIKELLNCPPDMELMTLLAVGYYNDDYVKDIKKKTIDEVLKWNSF
ncbi:MAG: nitroreductase family protein [Halanaerobiales bacterium]